LESAITDAITKQALRASRHGLWSLSSRGRPEERILVEGAGSEAANGIYYRIDGLINGDLYSKREVACGQQYVYTLSCSFHEPKDRYECRIFCSKLLTHLGVLNMVQRQRRRQPQPERAGITQPLLQVIQVEREENKSTTNSSIRVRRTFCFGIISSFKNAHHSHVFTFYFLLQMLLSDGDHYISATMAPGLVASNRSKEILQNTLIKVLDYERHVKDGRVSLELHKVALISQDPGHRFGNPFDYYDAFDEQYDCNDDDNAEEEEEELITTLEGEAIQTEVCQQALMHQQGNNNNPKKDNSIGTQQNLLKLYSCHYPVSAKPIDSKIQRTGWTVDSHGCKPSPKCRWMPGLPSAAAAAYQQHKPNYPNHHQTLKEKTNVSSSRPERGSPASPLESSAAVQ
jgi:hypothetical protein